WAYRRFGWRAPPPHEDAPPLRSCDGLRVCQGGLKGCSSCSRHPQSVTRDSARGGGLGGTAGGSRSRVDDGGRRRRGGARRGADLPEERVRRGRHLLVVLRE